MEVGAVVERQSRCDKQSASLRGVESNCDIVETLTSQGQAEGVEVWSVAIHTVVRLSGFHCPVEFLIHAGVAGGLGQLGDGQV